MSEADHPASPTAERPTGATSVAGSRRPLGDEELGPNVEAPTATAETEVAAPHRRLIFLICAMALFMASTDATIVATALPRIGAGLHTRLNWTGWTITIYQLGQMIALPLAGKISDQFGRKRIFAICTVLFTVSSLACGLSTSIGMLIPLRFLQALGGGAFMPSASGIVADHFGRDRDRALGMFTSVLPIGGIAGPIFGGLIAQFWTWRGIFFINIPIGIVLVILTIKFIPSSPPRGRTQRFDFTGMTLLTLTIVSGTLSITALGERGMSPADGRVLAPALGAVLLGWRLIRHLRRCDAPFIPIRLLHGKGFLIMNFMNVLYGAAALGFGALVPLYAESRYRIPITNAGTLLTSRAVAMALVATAATMLMRRTGYRFPMFVGFWLLAIGIGFLAIAPPSGVSTYLWLALFSMVTGIGMGCAAPATNNATLQLAPDQVGAISGLRNMFRQAGAITYLSVATSIFARSAHPGMTQAHLFLVQAAVLVLMSLLVFFVPDHRGRW